jgi:hypothetical protein
MYRFEAVTTSFMVEVPSASQEQLHLLEAYATLLPLGNFTTEEDKIVSAQVYLVHFLSRIKEISSPRKFVVRADHSTHPCIQCSIMRVEGLVQETVLCTVPRRRSLHSSGGLSVLER